MAMAVEEDFSGERGRGVVGDASLEEFGEEESLRAEAGGAGIFREKIAELIAEDRGATGFEDDDGKAGVDLGGERFEDALKIFFGVVKQAEIVEGAAAAELPAGNGGSEACGGEDIVSGAESFGVEGIVECVDPQEEFGGVRGLRG